MLRTLCTGPIIEKTRYDVADGSLVWAVDIYEGDLDGVAFAEIELDHEAQPVPLPAWIGREVTGDPRFRMRALCERNLRARELALDPPGSPGPE